MSISHASIQKTNKGLWLLGNMLGNILLPVAREKIWIKQRELVMR
jgi:hypothetical protein